MLLAIRRLLATWVDAGAHAHLPPQRAKRVRWTNAFSLLGFSIAVLSMPFDAVTAPWWMLLEDAFAAAVYLACPLLNGAGRYTASRLGMLVFSDLLMLFNGVLMGEASGPQLVYFALAALPFILFELDEWKAMLAGVVAALASFVFLEAAAFPRSGL